MNKSSEVRKNSNSFEEKEADNSDTVFRNSMESTISVDNSLSCSNPLNLKNAKSILVSSDLRISLERKKKLKSKHKKRDISRKLPCEEYQSNFKNPYEKCKVMKNKNALQKRIKISHGESKNKAVISKKSVSEKSALLMKDQSDFNLNLTETKNVEKNPMLEAKVIESGGEEKIWT